MGRMIRLRMACLQCKDGEFLWWVVALVAICVYSIPTSVLDTLDSATLITML